MTRIDAILALSLTTSVLAAACGSSDDPPPAGGEAGAAATAGAGGGGAGGAGSGGVSGAGGAGKGGAGGGAGASAGTGGSAGMAGLGGLAGIGGTAGAAGGAGKGGTAGTGGTGGGSGGCVDNGPPIVMVAPTKLSDTGLYTNIVKGTLAAYAKPFAPKYPLWSDGAEKNRFAYVPPCAKIDTSDMDHWAVPPGTRFWKEFAIAGVRVETRMIHKYGPDPEDVLFAVYQWRLDQTDADQVVLGVDNVNGTTHDIPKMAECTNCHAKLAERVLGFSAIQLSHTNAGETIKSLSDAGRLTVAAPNGFTVPGDATTSAALGYLHANCGNCHNPTGAPTDMHLRLSVKNATVQDTDAWTTAVNKLTLNFTAPGVTHLITGGDPDSSAVPYRMSKRGVPAAMPPIASKVSDAAGIKTISDWIKTLPP